MNIVQSWKKSSSFRSYALRTYLIFLISHFIRVSPEYLNLKLFPEQIQYSGIFRTRTVLKTLSIYLAYSEYREPLEHIVHVVLYSIFIAMKVRIKMIVLYLYNL